MRYIRTKTEIFDNWVMNGVMPELISPQTFGMDAIKCANTIKELCDCFIYTDEGCEPEILFEDDLPVFPTEESELYGAIWIKGEHNEPILKPVAKANDKGELELL